MKQRSRSRHIGRIAVVAAAFALVGSTTACSSPDSTGPAATGGTLTWSTGTALGTLDIVADQVDGTARRLLLGNVLESLTRVAQKDDGSLDWVPSLATEWKEVDPSTWQFTIRPDVKFQDGSTLDATDVAYSVNKLAKPESTKDSTLNVIAGADVVDDVTVNVNFTSPEPFGFRVVSTIPIEPDGWGDDVTAAETTAIGTGPYKLTEVSPTRDTATLEKFSGYWGGEVGSFDSIHMKLIPDVGARLAALKAGEIDVAFDLSPDLAAAAPAVLTAPSTEVEILRIKAESGPFSDLNARIAISHAIDTKSLIDNVRNGLAISADGQPVPAQVTGYNPDVKAYSYDAAKAKSMIDDAGLTGTTVSMLCATDYWGAVGADSCQAIAANIEATGLKVDVKLLPFDQWRDQGYLAKDNGLEPPDLLYIQAGSSAYNASAVLTNYFTCGSKATVCDPDLKAATQKALDEVDADQKAKDYQAVIKLAHDEAVLLPTVSPEVFAATQSNIKGTLYGDKSTVFWDEWTRQ